MWLGANTLESLDWLCILPGAAQPGSSSGKTNFSGYREVPHPSVWVQVRGLGITSDRKQGKEGGKERSTGGK